MLFPSSNDEEPDFYKMEPSPSPRAHAQYLANAIQRVQAIALDEKRANCGPLRVPGRLLYQPVETPTARRFVKVPSTQYKRRQAESLRWKKPLQLHEISTQLDHHSWNEPLPQEQTPKDTQPSAENTESSSSSSSKPRQTLKDLILLLE